MPEQLMPPQEVADYFGVPLATLYRWNSRGDGPRRIKVGRHVRYRREDVAAWVEQHTEQAV